MFRHDLNTGFRPQDAFHWRLMNFSAGSINAGGFLACERFVTHITGFATLSGIDLALGQWTNALGMLSVPLFFLAGVMAAAWLVATKRAKNLDPPYATIMGMIALCLVVAAAAGSFNVFGVFGTDFYLKHDYVLLALLCFASGLQNCAITISSSSTVRATHLTGPTTDLGIGLVEAFIVHRNSDIYSAIMRKNKLRIGGILSFLIGGAVGAFLFLKIKYLGFLLPAAIACYGIRIAKTPASQNTDSPSPQRKVALSRRSF
jgi:uncharacterized membrane protein YoaK (UPF0700 family)